MSSSAFRPMLAFNAPIEWYQERISPGFPIWYASPKLDGIRAIVRNGRLVSRTLKPIKNAFTQQCFGTSDLEGLDGELIVGKPSGEGVFARTSSGVMSEGGIPDVKFYVFDHLWNPRNQFFLRRDSLRIMLEQTKLKPFMDALIGRIVVVQQTLIQSAEQLAEFEAQMLAEGYEGLILKNRYGPYKYGRSTMREAGMGKLKRFKDSEAVITGFEELMHNGNEAKEDALGLTKRSSHQGNKVPMGTLGALQVRDIHCDPWVFNIGSGFDASMRQHIWDNREKYRGQVVKYKYLPIGTIELPRHPVFLGFRDREDM